MFAPDISNSNHNFYITIYHSMDNAVSCFSTICANPMVPPQEKLSCLGSAESFLPIMLNTFFSLQQTRVSQQHSIALFECRKGLKRLQLSEKTSAPMKTYDTFLHYHPSCKVFIQAVEITPF